MLAAAHLFLNEFFCVVRSDAAASERFYGG